MASGDIDLESAQAISRAPDAFPKLLGELVFYFFAKSRRISRSSSMMLAVTAS
jgi:hypothetical protein